MLDLKPLENLPPLTREEAAWLVGVTPEALDRILETVGESPAEALPLIDLIKAGFALLGRKEAQAAMLGLQLSRALEREKQLAEALRSRVLEEPAVPELAAAPAPRPLKRSEWVPGEGRAAKKKKKKKKKGAGSPASCSQ